MNKEQKIVAWIFGIDAIIAFVFIFILLRTESNKPPSPEFITTIYESPITGDCFEIVRRYNRSDAIVSIQIDCELIDDR